MQGAAEVGSRPSYAGDVIDIVIVVRTFLRRCPDKSAQFEELVGKESYAKFVDLCNRRLPPVEEYRSPQVCIRFQHVWQRPKCSHFCALR